MKHKILAAKIISLVVILALSRPILVHGGGIPVIDVVNIQQNTMAALENVAQTLKQIEEYKTQLQQYQDMLQNTMQPAQYIWDQAQSTIGELMTAVDTLNHYKQQLGSLDNYLQQFQDMDFYKNSPCFTSAGCSPEELAKIEMISELASAAQKIANDAVFKGLDKQQDALISDAGTLQQLQSAAQGATGRMEALQYANQFASQQANQLLQIRGLMIAQHNAVTTQMQAQADREARQEAGSRRLRNSRLGKTPSPKTWTTADLYLQ
jgi:P-type conjugative transfer protein TrbJ